MTTSKKTGQEKEAAGGEMLHEAAKAIGSALGAIAAKVGVTRAHGEEQPKKIGKLVSKAKERLPRKKKKKLAKKTSLAKSSQG